MHLARFTALGALFLASCHRLSPVAPSPPDESPATTATAAADGPSAPETEDEEPDLTPATESDAIDEPQPGAPLDATKSPAVQYAGLDRARCEGELGRRRIAYTPVG